MEVALWLDCKFKLVFVHMIVIKFMVAYSQIVRCGFVLIIDILKGRRDCLVTVVQTSDKWNRKTWTSMLS